MITSRFDALSTVHGIVRIAIDASLLAFKHFCKIWHPTSDPQACLVASMESLHSLVARFRKVGVEIVWCFDGVKSKDKLATQKRIDEHQRHVDDILRLYRLAQVSLGSPLKKLPSGQDGFADDLRSAEALSPEGDLSRLASFRNLLEPMLTASHEPDENGVNSTTEEIIACMEKKLKSHPFRPARMMEQILAFLQAKGCVCMKVEEVSEAEKLCSILCHLGVVNAVYSNDGDLIPMRTPVIIKDIKDGAVQLYKHADIMSCLGFGSHAELMALCIILGCDFNERIRGFGPVTAMKEVRKPNFTIEVFQARHGAEKVKAQVCADMLTVSEEELRLVSALL